MKAKAPVAPSITLLKPALPFESNHVFTPVAVAREFVSNWTAPAKVMLPFMALAKVTGGRGWRVALALWLNANITVQNAAATIASFFVGIMLIFIKDLCLHIEAAERVPTCKALLNKYFKYLSISRLRHDAISTPHCLCHGIVKYSDGIAPVSRMEYGITTTG
jgi:hypothetical protein